MRIELDRLKEADGKFSRVYSVDELLLGDDELRLIEPAEITGRARRNGTECELRGKLLAKVEAVCGRCLQRVEVPISTDFTERFVRAVTWAAEEQHELQEEDLNLAVFDGEAIELDDLVREEILLAVSGNVLCREDCQGLCPICGVDKNLSSCQCATKEIDSRWQKLEGLQS